MRSKESGLEDSSAVITRYHSFIEQGNVTCTFKSILLFIYNRLYGNICTTWSLAVKLAPWCVFVICSAVTVLSSVKDGLGPADDLFPQVFTAYIIAAFIDFAGMPDVHSPPTNAPVPDRNSTPEQKSQYLDKVIGSFVNSCLILPNVEINTIKLRNEQQNVPYPDACTVPCTILPGTLSCSGFIKLINKKKRKFCMLKTRRTLLNYSTITDYTERKQYFLKQRTKKAIKC